MRLIVHGFTESSTASLRSQAQYWECLAMKGRTSCAQSPIQRDDATHPLEGQKWAHQSILSAKAAHESYSVISPNAVG